MNSKPIMKVVERWLIGFIIKNIECNILLFFRLNHNIEEKKTLKKVKVKSKYWNKNIHCNLSFFQIALNKKFKCIK